MQEIIKNLPDIPYIGFRSFILAPIGALGIIFMIVLMGSLFQAESIIEQISTDDWVETKATVEFAEERKETTCDAEGNCTTDRWTHVEYIYEYENISYSGSTYTFLSKMGSGLSVDFPTGKEIDIFVDSENPHESLMIKGWDGIWIEAEPIFIGTSALIFVIYTVLTLLKIGFHLQSSEKKKKALDNHGRIKEEEVSLDSENNDGNKEQILKILPVYLGGGWVITNFVIFVFLTPEFSDEMTVRIGATSGIATLLLVVNIVSYQFISQNIRMNKESGNEETHTSSSDNWTGPDGTDTEPHVSEDWWEGPDSGL
tara:strand:- start:50 stop:988 length:939 start_codon:yes stop_codon:yes gene_type:complete